MGRFLDQNLQETMGVEAVLRFLIFYNMLTTVFGDRFPVNVTPIQVRFLQIRPSGPVHWSLASCCRHDALELPRGRRQ